MKLSDWARREGIPYKTAWRWWKAGKLPVPAYQTKTGAIMVGKPSGKPDRLAITFIRKSDGARGSEVDLHSRHLRLIGCAEEQGFEVIENIEGPMWKFHRILRNPKCWNVVIEADQFDPKTTRLLQAAMEGSGRKLVLVVQQAEEP